MKKSKRKFLSATLILLAHGRGKRYKSSPRKLDSSSRYKFSEKQFSLLDGLPVYLYSLRTFYQSEHIQAIVIVSPKKYHRVLKEQITENLCPLFSNNENDFNKQTKNFSKPIFFTAGGKERYLSVYEGLQYCPSTTDYVFVHDAARPLIHPLDLKSMGSLLLELCKKNEHAALIPVCRATDSIKETNREGIIQTHLKRNFLRFASTPQCLPMSTFKNAYEIFLSQQKTIPTDDAEIYALSQAPIYTLELSYPNPKLTYQSDKWLILQLLKEKNIRT